MQTNVLSRGHSEGVGQQISGTTTHLGILELISLKRRSSTESETASTTPESIAPSSDWIDEQLNKTPIKKLAANFADSVIELNDLRT
jgi:hypothetical protein